LFCETIPHPHPLLQEERGEKAFKDDVIYQEYNKKSNLFLPSL
jgi:hypothetical protein